MAVRDGIGTGVTKLRAADVPERVDVTLDGLVTPLGVNEQAPNTLAAGSRHLPLLPCVRGFV